MVHVAEATIAASTTQDNPNATAPNLAHAPLHREAIKETKEKEKVKAKEKARAREKAKTRAKVKAKARPRTKERVRENKRVPPHRINKPRICEAVLPVVSLTPQFASSTYAANAQRIHVTIITHQCADIGAKENANTATPANTYIVSYLRQLQTTTAHTHLAPRVKQKPRPRPTPDIHLPPLTQSQSGKQKRKLKQKAAQLQQSPQAEQLHFEFLLLQALCLEPWAAYHIL